MFYMSLRDLAESIVRHELLNRKRPDKDCRGSALHLHFDVRMSDYLDETNGIHLRAGIHLLYHQSVPGSGYIDVFSARLDDSWQSVYHVKNWTHETSHDCGRGDIKVFNETFYQMEKTINEARTKHGLPERRPCDIHQYVTFAPFTSDNMIQFVPVEVMYDKTDKFGYRRLVKVLKEK